MGNCLNSSAKVHLSQSSNQTSDGLKASLNSGLSSNPSSYKETSNGWKDEYERACLPLAREEILPSPNLKNFSFNELKNATRNFRPESVLGEGGFGCVYKGWIDEQTLIASKPGYGIVVAVKRLRPEGYQGHKEWLTEVHYLGQLQHPNLVKLFGYCCEGDDRLLVYEYMTRGSLENHLFRRGAQPLSWATRMKVAIGAARGLSFLHDAESQVIYRDFKASNILLDSDFDAKLSDFGLAKAGPTGDRTHVSTQVIGTQGYAAPEYIATGRLSARSDVYSFGVTLLELITGRRALDKSTTGIDQSLVDWTRPYLGDKRRLFRIMDTKLEGQYPQKEAHAVAALATQCLSLESKSRPKMSQVLATLEQLQSASSASSKTSANPSDASTPAQNSPLRSIPSLQVPPKASPLPPRRPSPRMRSEHNT